MRSPEERTAQFMDINRCVDDDGRSIVTNHWHTQVYDEWNAHTWHHTIPRSHIEEWLASLLWPPTSSIPMLDIDNGHCFHFIYTSPAHANTSIYWEPPFQAINYPILTYGRLLASIQQSIQCMAHGSFALFLCISRRYNGSFLLCIVGAKRQFSRLVDNQGRLIGYMYEIVFKL